MRISLVEWDRKSVRKIEGHDLDPEDVESLFEIGEPIYLRHPKVPGRYISLGFVPDGRFVLVVFAYNRRRRAARVVTAYEPTDPSWRIRYDAIHEE